jgi:hypothetical protein
MPGEAIWFRDPSGFLSYQKWTNFIPLSSMTYEEKLNALMRFAAILSVLLFVVTGGTNGKAFYIVVLVGISTYALQLVHEKELREEFNRRKKQGLRHDRRLDTECSVPTKDNPFANILLTDYGNNPHRRRGCDITKKKTKKMTESFFSDNLYKDIDDIWSKRTSSRSFYQTPIQTIPNDQSGFADWLYGRKGRKSCKEGNGAQCVVNRI